MGAVGLLITVLALLFDRLVKRVYSDEGYQESRAELQEREKARTKELQQGHPTAAGPKKETRSRWSMGVYAFIFLLFVWIGGLIVGAVYLSESEVDFFGLTMSAANAFNLVLVLLTIVILFLALRRRDPEELENPSSDNNPVDWGYIWVVVSGLLIVGIGAGAAWATRGG